MDSKEVKYEVRFCANDFGGSLCSAGVVGTLEEARELALEVAGSCECLCDPWFPWAVEVDASGKERSFNGKLIVHEFPCR